MKFRIKQLSSDRWRISAAIKRESRQYRMQETFTGNRKLAERRYLEMLEVLEVEAETTGRTAAGSLTLFSEAISFYLARKTVNRGSSCYIERMKKEFGTLPVTELKRPFETFLFNLRAGGKNRAPAKNSTINSYIVYAKAALNLCVLHEAIENNPLKNIRTLRVIPRDTTLSTDERERLLTVLKAEAPHLWPIVNYCLQVPCRKSEMVNAGRDDYSEVAGAIRIRNGTTKNDRGVWKPIPPDMEEYFKTIPKDCQYLFFKEGTDREGRKIYASLGDFKKSWMRALELADIEDFRFHDLRHIAATDLIHAGNSERAVMQVAGWRTNMLSTYYHRDGLAAVRGVAFASKRPATDSRKEERAG